MTTVEKTREGEFIERIEKLNTGELAMLRRGCGERGLDVYGVVTAEHLALLS